MAKRQVWWSGDNWRFSNGEPLPGNGALVAREESLYPNELYPPTFWVEVPDDPKPAPKVKFRTLYTLTVNGIEIEAEEKVWRALRAQLVDLFGVYDPSTPPEER